MPHHRVVIVGGGNAGLSTAGRLRRLGVRDVAVVDPRDRHVYQPLLSHVAGGTARASEATRPQTEVMPRGVARIRDAVVAIDPEARTIALESGGELTYDHVVVCPGMQHDWDRIPGLRDAIGTARVASHYELELARKTSRLLRSMREGTAVFTQPPGPVSCAGASQKPMYLACDYWRALGVLDRIRVVLVLPDPTLAGLPIPDEELARKVAEYGIEVRYSSELRAVDGDARTVDVGPVGGAGDPVETIGYDVLNVVPPQSAPDWIAASGLAAADDPLGFVEVDPETLRHARHDTVWALGDAAATRNSKSGGALRKQTTALAKNLAAVLAGREPSNRYDDYSVCPYTVSRSTLVFAEFDARMQPKPTIPFWPGLARERRSTWITDRHVLPRVYWNLILKGRA